MMLKTTIVLALVACALGANLPSPRIGLRHYPRRLGSGSRIVGGHDATPGQFPWQISLQIELLGIHSHSCGGSILTEEWILTAAHCVVGGEPGLGHFLVVAGEYDFDITDPNEQSSRVAEIVVHPEYPDAPVVAPFDVALIRLTTPLTFTDRVKPIALPVAASIPEGNSTLSGWGSTGGFLFPHMPSILQTADLPIVPFSECQAVLGDSPLVDTNVCTGPLTGGFSACSGDSGGPLVQTGADGSVSVIGIVSWGMIPCGEENAPSVFTRVSAYNDFITTTIGAK